MTDHIIETDFKLRRDEPVVIAGSASVELARQIAWGMGGYVHPMTVGRFSDGEIEVELGASVRKRHVFIVQTLAQPIHDNLMELMLITDACRRASAAEITLIVPYLAYSRQDRKAKPRSPISAKVVARMLETAGADRVITFDLHSGQVQGFYDVPCDNLPGATVLAPVVQKALMGDDICFVATDMNGMHRVRKFAARLDVDGDGEADEWPMAVVDKRKAKAGAGADAVIGEVSGRHCILVDDMVGTGASLVEAAGALRAAGAGAVSVVVTHGIFSGDAIRKIAGGGFQTFWVTDTLTVPEDVAGLRGVTVVSIVPLLVKVVRRIVSGDSLEEIYS